MIVLPRVSVKFILAWNIVLSVQNCEIGEE